jgi:dephospho-CoA kinase
MLHTLSFGYSVNKRIIGLTGGIATGKSAVGKILVSKGFPIADADIIARAAVAPGSLALEQIAQRYGSSVLLDDRNLNRSALAKTLFHDPIERQWIEQCIHPFVRQKLIDFCNEHQEACLIVPLLFEAKMTDLASEIWVVTCSLETQRQRLAQRDHLDAQQIEARLQSQWPIAQKEALATVILDNNGDLDSLVIQVHRALERL